MPTPHQCSAGGDVNVFLTEADGSGPRRMSKHACQLDMHLYSAQTILVIVMLRTSLGSDHINVAVLALFAVYVCVCVCVCVCKLCSLVHQFVFVSHSQVPTNCQSEFIAILCISSEWNA